MLDPKLHKISLAGVKPEHLAEPLKSELQEFLAKREAYRLDKAGFAEGLLYGELLSQGEAHRLKSLRVGEDSASTEVDHLWKVAMIARGYSEAQVDAILKVLSPASTG